MPVITSPSEVRFLQKQTLWKERYPCIDLQRQLRSIARYINAPPAEDVFIINQLNEGLSARCQNEPATHVENEINDMLSIRIGANFGSRLSMINVQ
jgi:hypothetical protein